MVRQRSPNNMVFARRVALAGIASVGWHFVPSNRMAFGRTIHIAFSTMILIFAAFGLPLDAPAVTILTCSAILLLGLPHGTFDLALIKQAYVNQQLPAIIGLYLFGALAMYVLWHTAAGLALLLFFILSIIHFAEDWSGKLPPFLAHGTATAMLSAPALLHQDVIGSLFEVLVGGDTSQIFAAVAVLIAPVALATAAAATVTLWIDGRRSDASATAVALCAMIFLPPLVGFALFFCLMHSPAQFAAAQQTLDWQKFRQWVPVVLPLTGAALGIAAFVFATFGSVTFTGTMIATAFMTLSILTLPHLAVPMIVERLSSRATA